MTETTETYPIEKAKAHITGLPGFSEYCDYLYSRQGHELPPAGDFLCAISKLVTSLTKERDELKDDVTKRMEVADIICKENRDLKSQLSKAEEENKELKEKLEFKTNDEPPLYSYPTQEGEKLDTNDIHDEETLKQLLIISDSHHSPIPYNLHRITETKWVVLGLDNSIHLFDKGWEAEKFVQKAENKDRFNKSKVEEE